MTQRRRSGLLFAALVVSLGSATPAGAQLCRCEGSFLCCQQGDGSVCTLDAACIECAGDCDDGGSVQNAELVTMIGIALGKIGYDDCILGDADASEQIDVTDAVAAVGNQIEGCERPTSSMSWHLTDDCEDGTGIDARLFDRDRPTVWPSVSTVYAIASDQTETTSITCNTGDLICYGGRLNPDDGTHLGVDLDGSRGCENCCALCADTTIQATLPCTTAAMIWDFNDHCADDRGIDLRLFDEDNDVVYPSSTDVFAITSGGTRRITIDCRIGAKICYGGAPNPPNDRSWGVGLEDTMGCMGCCYFCQESRVGFDLICE